jgi:hypothetical protein
VPTIITEPTYANTTGLTGRRRQRTKTAARAKAAAPSHDNLSAIPSRDRPVHHHGACANTPHLAATATDTVVATCRRRHGRKQCRYGRKHQPTGARPAKNRSPRNSQPHVAATVDSAPANDVPLPFTGHFALHGNAFNPNTGRLAE